MSQFKEGLTEINTPYAHQEVTAVKLISVPLAVLRKYDDRGWTLYESILIDGKESSAIIGTWGEHNVLTLADDFDPEDGSKSGRDFIKAAAKSRRQAPCTPEKFAKLMNLRADRATGKGVKLFTNGTDVPSY